MQGTQGPQGRPILHDTEEGRRHQTGLPGERAETSQTLRSKADVLSALTHLEYIMYHIMLTSHILAHYNETGSIHAPSKMEQVL